MLTEFTKNQQSKDKNHWDWLPCVYDFKQEYDGKEIIWNLSPYVMISGADEKVSNLLQRA